MIITFKAIHGLAPSYICELINIKESGGYNLRSHKGLLLQAPRLVTYMRLGECAFMATAPKLWNSFPINICNEENFNPSKILLKTYILKELFIKCNR